MSGPIKISFLADVGRAQKDIAGLAKGTEKAGEDIEASGTGMAGGLDKVGQAAVGMNAAVDAATSALSAIDAIQQSARTEAMRLARANLAVEQAMLDGEQAAVDLRQATVDLRQAQLDGRQSAVDVTQAQIDAKQATLDMATAQDDYTAAVKESGAGSAEARQAAIDLEQAQSDLRQAGVDLTQAQEDARQATVDVAQAQLDGKDAATRARTATLDLSDAQSAIDPTPVQRAMHAFELWAPVLAAATIAAQAMSAATTRATVATVAQKVATGASAAATGVWTAAQWLLNVALAANPVGLIIIAIAALVAGIIYAYKHSETFRRIVDAAFRAVQAAAAAAWNWIKDHWRLLLGIITGPIGAAVMVVISHWDKIVSTARAIQGKVKAVFSGIGGWLRDAGARLVQGFIDGIQARFASVKALLGRLTGLLPDWKGPASRDRDLLRDNGKLVMAGFLSGLESGYSEIHSSLAGLTGDIAVGVPRVAPAADADARGTPIILEFRLTGDPLIDAIIELLRKKISAKGGSVQTVLGR